MGATPRLSVVVRMFISHGDTSKLQGLPWHALELTASNRVEVVTRRLSDRLKAIFPNGPAFEIFVPVGRRDCGVYELLTHDFLYARTADFKNLMRLYRASNGVKSIVHAEAKAGNFVAITIDDAHVRAVIEKCEAAFHARSAGIVVGSFVRVLDSACRDLCGEVESLADDRAVVRISMQTRLLHVSTPVANLLCLDAVPVERRVFYYTTQIDDLPAETLAIDLQFVADKLRVEPPAPRLWQNHITVRVRRLVDAGEMDPFKIAKKMIAGIRSGELIPPKNGKIVFDIVKSEIMRKLLPLGCKDFRSAGKFNPPCARFNKYTFGKIDPAWDLPYETPLDKIAQDGRSRRKLPRPPVVVVAPGPRARGAWSAEAKARHSIAMRKRHEKAARES